MTYLEILNYISAPHLGWSLLLIASAVDAALPLFLALFIRRFSNLYEPTSAIGAPSSPVRSVYRDWRIFAGLCFLVAAPQVYYAYQAQSAVLSWALAACLGVYGAVGCIVAGIAAPPEGDRPKNTREWVHMSAAAAGSGALTLSALLLSILQFLSGSAGQGTVSIVGFACGVVFTVLFRLSGQDRFAGTAVGWLGLWQRLAVVSAYVPLICAAAAYV